MKSSHFDGRSSESGSLTSGQQGRGDVQITKAVITAAGRGARQYPASDTVQKAMLPLVDRDGLTKPVLQIIAEEALESGIEEICVVSAPGDEAVYRDQFRNYAANLRSAYKGVDWAEEQARRLVELEQRLRFAVQPEPEGYGHAVWCARDVRRRPAVPAPAGRPPLHLGRAAALRPAVDRPGRRRELRRLGRAGDPRAPDPPVRHAHRPAAARASRGLRHRRDHREAEPDPGRAAAPGARPPRGALPLLLRHARADPGRLRPARRPGPRQRPRSWADPAHDGTERPGPARDATWPSRPAARGTTWASSSASSRPRSPWPWPASTASGCSRSCSRSMIRIEQNSTR